MYLNSNPPPSTRTKRENKFRSLSLCVELFPTPTPPQLISTSSRSSLPRRDTSLLPCLDVPLRKHNGGLDELHGVDDVLAETDGPGDEGDDPGPLCAVEGGEGKEVAAEEEELVAGAEEEEDFL